MVNFEEFLSLSVLHDVHSVKDKSWTIRKIDFTQAIAMRRAAECLTLELSREGWTGYRWP
jgi:hypothetical protein